MFFFLVFGTIILRVFSIPLSMVRVVGGIILVRIGFTLFSSSSAGLTMGQAGSGQVEKDGDVAFVRPRRAGMPSSDRNRRILCESAPRLSQMGYSPAGRAIRVRCECYEPG